MAPRPVDLFRRRAAARQHRPRLYRRLPDFTLDEPTASLDSKNSAAVIELIEQAKARGAAIVGIFHDDAVRHRVADRLHPMGTNV